MKKANWWDKPMTWGSYFRWAMAAMGISLAISFVEMWLMGLLGGFLDGLKMPFILMKDKIMEIFKK